VALVAIGCKEKVAEPVREPDPYGFERCEYLADTSEVRSGESFSLLLPRLGASMEQMHAFKAICADAKCFNPSKVIAGKRVTAYYAADTINVTDSGYEIRRGPLRYIVYDHDRVNSTIFQCTDSLAVWQYAKPVEHQRKIADVTISTSLWVDMLESGTSPLLIMELADIYAWTVNFFTLQDGDRFRVIYTQSVCDGEIFQIDDVEFCIYDSGKTHLPAIKFDQHDGKNKWWNEKGESMRKAFLKAPLKYNRISSRFTYRRKHPVTGKIRPHTAVDYAAPSGTPVHTIGDGVITQCGWDSSGGGNRIRIKHANGFETCYMHLRGFAKGIRAGARVSQGQLIGYVGSTGRSTGPHLDFRIWKDRKPVDPLKMISPPAKPLANDNLDSLKVLYQGYLAEMEQAEAAKNAQPDSTTITK